MLPKAVNFLQPKTG